MRNQCGRGHRQFNREYNSTILLCAWLFVHIHAIASLYLKMQITDVTSMPPAAGGGGGGGGGDGGDSADDGPGHPQQGR